MSYKVVKTRLKTEFIYSIKDICISFFVVDEIFLAVNLAREIPSIFMSLKSDRSRLLCPSMDSHVQLDYLTSWEPLNKLGIGQITFQLVEYTSNWYFWEKSFLVTITVSARLNLSFLLPQFLRKQQPVQLPSAKDGHGLKGLSFSLLLSDPAEYTNWLSSTLEEKCLHFS